VYYSTQKLSFVPFVHNVEEESPMFQFMAIFFLIIGIFLAVIGVALSVRAYRSLVEGKEAAQMLELESEELFGVFVFCLGTVLAGSTGILLIAFH